MWDGTERRHYTIPDEVIERIADLAVEKALNRVYQEVGKSIIRKMAWIIGAVFVSGAIWLAAKGQLIK